MKLRMRLSGHNVDIIVAPNGTYRVKLLGDYLDITDKLTDREKIEVRRRIDKAQ